MRRRVDADLGHRPIIPYLKRPFASASWWGLFAPAGTPNEVLERIHADTVVALRAGDVRERLANLSVEPGGGSRAEFADYVRAEIAKYDRIVKQLAIKAE